ncbi:XRE family transcriptional regulator [Paenibacillus sp. FSL R7-269]|uniref:helix-turn-helix domain-containing protein n=1 Tax=Paenibacillus sp. FSL R7-269 TaxID=1226755 RepID=UPI0003E2668C|nr:helix-turn-helix transcriptional regulator [Paenibacillus sp. FSL R7-269]ETT53152.1 XRE family transcriptional regulator [Paenibacillus sp. FSL R7-269]
MKLDIGTKLNFLRKQQKVSLRTLSKASGVSLAYLSHIENGKRTPSPYILQKLAPVLKVPLAELMQDAGYLNEKEDSEYHEDVFLDFDSFNHMELTHMIKLPFILVDGIEINSNEADQIIAFARALIFQREHKNIFPELMNEFKNRLEKGED